MKIHGNVVDIHEGRIFSASVHIEGAKITSISPNGHRTKGFLIPGFVDSYVHIESSLLPPTEFARLAIRHGTLAALSPFTDIEACAGPSGIESMLASGRKTPFKFFHTQTSTPMGGLTEGRAHMGKSDPLLIPKEALLSCLPLIQEDPNQCRLCSDRIDPESLQLGHINQMVRSALQHGVDPIDILKTACLHETLPIGLLRENDPADFLIVEDLETLRVLEAYIEGQCVFKNGVLLPRIEPPRLEAPLPPVKRLLTENLSPFRGALAATMPHALLALGHDESDLRAAIEAVEKARGGIALSHEGKTDLLPLPIAGLMSPLGGEELARRYSDLKEAAQALGLSLNQFLRKSM